MGRRRKSNSHLPARVYMSHGAFYFVDVDGRWINLGRTLPDMYRRLADLVEDRPLLTMSDVFQKYRFEVLPQKAPRTQIEDARYLTRLDKVFGKMLPAEVSARHVYKYRHEREHAGKTTANHELGVLKHVFSKSVEWGVLDFNPARDVRKFSIQRRTRYVTDEEFSAVWSVAPPMVQVAMELALLTALRRGDILALTRGHLTEEGIRIETRKTGKELTIQWSPALIDVIERAKQLRPQVRQALVANRRGKAYTGDGFATQWDRTMRRALKNGLAESFRFHDLRAKSASDDTLQAATERLGHGDAATTKRYYRRGPERVRPLR